MEKYKLFFERLEEFSLNNKLEILKSIFGINILFYSLIEFKDSISFKCYDGATYYQFNFIFLFDNCEDYFNIIVKNRIILCDIFVNNFVLEEDLEIVKNDNFSKFLKFLIYSDWNYLDSFFNG